MNARDGAPEYADETVADFLDALASTEPAPAAGPAAAVCVALAAALVAMSARAAAGRLRSADRTAARGDELRARALRLAGEDALAYADVLKTQRMPEGEERDRALATALSAAAGAPLEITEIAAEIADAAAGLASEGVPALRGEALTALWLAESGARAATELVRIDVRAAGRAGGRLSDAERALARARDAVRRATARGDSAAT